ncbi:hypothetical protein INR49_018889 [Caranx melampygus]|nr:hypothetical protein INR49_018889 [Caranx melampygus]
MGGATHDVVGVKGNFVRLRGGLAPARFRGVTQHKEQQQETRRRPTEPNTHCGQKRVRRRTVKPTAGVDEEQ